MNRRFAKLYLVLFTVALFWHAPSVFRFAKFLAGFCGSLLSDIQLISLERDLPGLLVVFGFAVIFLWPKLYCFKLAWAVVRNRPIKTGILCGVAPIVALVPLTIELAVLILAFFEWHTAWRTGMLIVFGIALLFAVDLMIWVLLCSSKRTRQSHPVTT